MREDVAELLSDEEQADLERVIVGLPIAVRAAAEVAYVEGRVAGLCREGALELAADVVGEAARASDSSVAATGDR